MPQATFAHEGANIDFTPTSAVAAETSSSREIWSVSPAARWLRMNRGRRRSRGL